ncbi:MAG: two-component regulator propeller domain-containing protein [Acidobacteriota bacterium]
MDPHKAITQYVHNVWTVDDGLPQSSVLAIAQTRDGYLWFGTFEGLVRFDGTRFVVFDQNNSPGILDRYVLALFEDREGDLWVGTDRGLSRLHNGKFTAYTTQDGLAPGRVNVLQQARDGSLWIGGNNGLTRFHNGKFTVYTTAQGLSHSHVHVLHQDRAGRLWIGTNAGLDQWNDGHFLHYDTRHGLPPGVVQAIYEDRQNRLWIGTRVGDLDALVSQGGLAEFRNGHFTVYTTREGLSFNGVKSLLGDRDGNLWIGTVGGGVNRLRDGKFTAFTTKDTLSNNEIRALYEDREGSLWIGTRDGGLNRLRDGKFTPYALTEGLANEVVETVYEDREGSLWIGTRAGGMARLQNGVMTTFTTRDGLPGNRVNAFWEDAAGKLWIGTSTGLGYWQQGRFRVFTRYDGLPEEHLTALTGDAAGNLWIGTLGGGVIRYRDRQFTAYTKKDGLTGPNVNIFHSDHAGNLWIGLATGLSLWRDGQLSDQTALLGSPVNVQSLYADAEGYLWIGTRHDGLFRLKDGQVARYRVKDGLFDDLVGTIQEDNQGNFWISCNKGIFRISRQELQDQAAGKIKTVHSIAYGVSDGMKNRECNFNQGLWKANDGRLWFATVKGAVVIDPARILFNPIPPPVIIEQVNVDGKASESSALPGEVRLSPGWHNLEFQYAGLSLFAPEKVKYRYRLEGYDADWIEAEMRHTAYYTSLPPGSYTFHVIAANNDGVWNSTGQSLRVVVLPPFYRTWWFLTLAILGLGGLLFSGYELRIRRLKKAQAAQQAFSQQLIESQEYERKRIAAELHDSLGQNLMVVKNRAMLGAMALPDEQAKVRFNEISASIAQTLEEVRAIAYNLRPYHLDQLGLTTAIVATIQRVAASCEIEFTSEVDDLDGLFAPAAEITLYRIVQESLNNIVKHSQATEAQVRVRCGERELEVIIRDNGRGFVIQTPDQTSGKGFGLIGLAERVRMLGGSYTIHSQPGDGTVITVKLNLPEGGTVPGAVATGLAGERALK